MKNSIMRDRPGTSRSRLESTESRLGANYRPISRQPGYRRRRRGASLRQPLIQLPLPFDDPPLDR